MSLKSDKDSTASVVEAVDLPASPPPSSTDGSGIKGLPRTSDTPYITLIPASQFTFDDLTEAYNQTRVDYMVPMPMNTDRLRRYVHNYDVDMDRSVVAMVEDRVLGLGMLGVRPGHAWITRLGVLPVKRRRGSGEVLMKYLIRQAQELKVDYIVLEVIRGNKPAHRLFSKLGFEETRELLVLRRPPGPPAIEAPAYQVEALNYHQAIALLNQRQSTPSWLDETASLENAGNLAALCVELESGDRGWLVYQNTAYQLGRLVFQTETGDPHNVALALLHALHRRHSVQDTKTENLPVNDPHWPAIQTCGYLESFRRIEMRLDLK